MCLDSLVRGIPVVSFRLAVVLFLSFALALFVRPVSAQSVLIDGGVNISHPPAGSVLKNNDIIYFNPGEINIHEWRITIGASPDNSGFFDSGVNKFSEVPWEIAIDGLPNDGKPVTLRFLQRDEGGTWLSSEIVYNTGSDGPAATLSDNSSPAAPAVVTTPVLISNSGPIVADLVAEHRNGQTFLTWVEVSGEAGYHVYRHTSPITESNIGTAEKLTGKWGPLDSDTSVNKDAHGRVPATFVISDSGQPLSESNGLFVYTPVSAGNAFYAVTTVIGNTETIALTAGKNSLSTAVVEAVSDPKPVLALSLNRGRGRVYTQYMDYANWNPTFNGYAYNYSVALPARYRKSQSYPLLIEPHAYGEKFKVLEESEFGWQVIQLFPSDPGVSSGAVNSWWFGYAADHNYRTGGTIPTSGSVANFTERRVMQAVKDTIDDPTINVDEQLVHAFGHSMGASGSLSLGMRYGNIIAGIYGSESMTNYRTSPVFQLEFEQLWGSQSANLPIVISGPYTDPIRQYQGTGVWDWMDHHKQLADRRGEDMAYLMLAQGKADDVIDWNTQGAPMARVFNEASVGFSSHFVAGAGHSWLGFVGIVDHMFGFGNGLDFPWRYPLNMSFPSIQNATGSGSMTPGLVESDRYNMNIEWATPHTRFAEPIVDEPGRYEISLRSQDDDQTADITPRNTRRFNPQPGQNCEWITSSNNKRRTYAKGTVTTDEDALVTVPQVPITYKGTRLSINCG